MADVLCIVAHPDDESLFAGGTLARLSANGAEVVVVALSDGVSSRGWSSQEAFNRRCQHFMSACREIGAHPVLKVSFPDQRSDAVPQLSINRVVEEQIEGHQPMMVFTHFRGDLNHDHERVARAVMVATRGGKAHVYSMAPEFDRWTPWVPDTEWDISEHVEAKVAACLCYKDEMREFPHPRSERAIREQTVERFLEIR
jgi:LmbE family N-acetylglucosaminyl deacetylase